MVQMYTDFISYTPGRKRGSRGLTVSTQILYYLYPIFVVRGARSLAEHIHFLMRTRRVLLRWIVFSIFTVVSIWFCHAMHGLKRFLGSEGRLHRSASIIVDIVRIYCNRYYVIRMQVYFSYLKYEFGKCSNIVFSVEIWFLAS